MLNSTTFALIDDINPEEEIILGDGYKQEEDEAAMCFVFGILWSLSAILPLLGTILWMDNSPFNGTEALIKGLGHFMVITFIVMCSQMLAPLTMDEDEPLITPATKTNAPTIEPWYRVVMWSSIVLLLMTLAGEVYILTLAEDWAATTLVVISIVITTSLLCLCCGAVCFMYDLQRKQQQVAKRVQAEGSLFFSSWHLSQDPLPFNLFNPARFVRRYNDAARSTPGIGSTLDAVMAGYAREAEHLSPYELVDKQREVRWKVWDLLEKYEAKTEKEGVTKA
jgi:hypothetical protein